MFWIFRRTGAVNFFNSINNNYAAKSTVNNNTITGMHIIMILQYLFLEVVFTS